MNQTEAAEAQTWIRFAASCGYLAPKQAAGLDAQYDALIAMLVSMTNHADKWIL